VVRYYASDVTKFSDEELKTLSEEIAATGLLEGDDDGEWRAIDGYGPETWQFQAHERWSELIKEQHRRYDLVHPEEVAQRAAMDRTTFLALCADEFIFRPRTCCLITGIAVPMDGGTYIQEPIQYGDISEKP
jgi:hypothetical protein